MGIKKLQKFLSEKNIYSEYFNLNTYAKIQRQKLNTSNICIGIDFMLYAHKFSKSYNNMFIGFWNQTIKFLSCGITPLYIFDGKAPPEKSETIQERQEQKKVIIEKIELIKGQIKELVEITDSIIDDTSLDVNINKKTLEQLELEQQKLEQSIVHIKNSDIKKFKKMLDFIGISYLEAESEGDFLCAKLFSSGYINACLTDDMDMLPLGCKKVIRFNGSKIIEYDMDYTLKCLGINYNQFLDMCIVFGCDYLKLPFRINQEDIYMLIKKYGTFTRVVNYSNHPVYNKNNKKIIEFMENFMKTRDLFITAKNKETIPKYYDVRIRKKLDIKEIREFFVSNSYNIEIEDNIQLTFAHINKIFDK
jgi:5'-3' exonuclease